MRYGQYSEMENRAKYQALKYYLAGSIGVKSQHVDIQGSRYRYLEAGKRNKATIILLHAFGLSSNQWIGFMHLLSRDLHVIAPDIPGLSPTNESPDKRYTFRSLSNWLKAFTDTLSLDAYHLLGFSAGACVATQHAISQTDNVNSLVLLGFPDLLYPKANMHENLFDTCRYEEIKTIDDVKKLWVSQFYEAPKIPTFMSRMFLETLKSQKPFLLNVLTDISESSPLLMAKLHQIECPTLFIKGSHDQSSSQETLEFTKRAISTIKCKTINHAGHFAYLEKKSAIVREVHNFLREELNKTHIDQSGLMHYAD